MCAGFCEWVDSRIRRFGVSWTGAAMATFAEAPKGNEKAGEKIFKTKCAQCHAVEQSAGHKQGLFRLLL